MTKEIKTLKNAGDVSLCNLASIDVVEFWNADEELRNRMCYNVVNAVDLAITNNNCPLPEANLTNEDWRYIGIGILNLANLLALNEIVIDTQEAAEFQDELMDDLSFRLYRSSMLLAKKKGSFPKFKETKWAEGLTPVHESLRKFPQAWKLTEYSKTKFNKERWDKLGEEIKEFGLRNAQVMAIAPTASSAKAINATESTEPVLNLVYKEEGVFNATTLAPNLRKNLKFYKPAFECNQKNLVLNAIVRQKYLDQAQSITLYLRRADSLKEMTELHNFGFENGIKTFYYLKQQKHIEMDECTACTV